MLIQQCSISFHKRIYAGSIYCRPECHQAKLSTTINNSEKSLKIKGGEKERERERGDRERWKARERWSWTELISSSFMHRCRVGIMVYFSEHLFVPVWLSTHFFRLFMLNMFQAKNQRKCMQRSQIK